MQHIVPFTLQNICAHSRTLGNNVVDKLTSFGANNPSPWTSPQTHIAPPLLALQNPYKNLVPHPFDTSNPTWTPPSTTFEQSDTTKWYGKYTNYFLTHSITRDTFLLNACIYSAGPLENTIPTWLYPCLCTTRPCQCLAILKLDILITTTSSVEEDIDYSTQNLSVLFTSMYIFCEDSCDPPQQPN